MLRQSRKLALCAAIAAILCQPVAARDFEWGVPAAADLLDETRAGFESGSGLLLSFGIERAAYINGDLVATTSFNFPDLGEAGATHARAPDMMVIRDGAVDHGLRPGMGTIIQNSLDGQQIGSLTVINASANSLALLRESNWQSLVNDAFVESLQH